MEKRKHYFQLKLDAQYPIFKSFSVSWKLRLRDLLQQSMALKPWAAPQVSSATSEVCWINAFMSLLWCRCQYHCMLPPSLSRQMGNQHPSRPAREEVLRQQCYTNSFDFFDHGLFCIIAREHRSLFCPCSEIWDWAAPGWAPDLPHSLQVSPAAMDSFSVSFSHCSQHFILALASNCILLIPWKRWLVWIKSGICASGEAFCKYLILFFPNLQPNKFCIEFRASNKSLTVLSVVPSQMQFLLQAEKWKFSIASTWTYKSPLA